MVVVVLLLLHDVTLNNERVVVAPHCKDSVIEARHSHGSPALNRVAHT